MHSRKLEMTVNHTNLTFSGLKCDLFSLFSFTHSGVNMGGTKVYIYKKRKKKIQPMFKLQMQHSWLILAQLHFLLSCGETALLRQSKYLQLTFLC